MTEREREMAEHEEALAALVATGLVLEVKGRDGRTRYTVNPQKVDEIRALLKDWGRNLARQGSDLCARSY